MHVSQMKVVAKFETEEKREKSRRGPTRQQPSKISATFARAHLFRISSFFLVLNCFETKVLNITQIILLHHKQLQYAREPKWSHII